MNAIDIIKSYLEGSLSPKEFQKELYKNKDIENLLSEETQMPPYTNSLNLYLYLIELDILSITGEMDSKDLLSQFLTKKNINFSLNDSYEKNFNLLMKIQPEWLDLDLSYFQFILNKHKDKTGTELERTLKLELKQSFKFVKNKPEWLQSAEWPIEDNEPLLFMGQLDITKIRHDTSYLYIFFNEKDKTFTIFEQAA